ncbi:hypothetical protein K3169_14095 [Pseudomonas phytophila]|uniref:Uncharacterized protein n=1 Tax=Pseudomonas phytophila TaxID=2867264 RepID=A0ABY6FN06_9PSED|nr:hypothetical protein [Pseudomonas phytophila]UXZ98916.1 hypothetical protein K3169_14095 [Pseudomonas phytophila]
MTFGVRTWNAKGDLEMDTDSFTYQVIHNQVYQLNGTNAFSISIPGFNTSNCVATVLPISSSNSGLAKGAMPFVSVASGSVSVSSRNPQEPNADSVYGSQIQFRLLVMRYKN